MNAKKKMILFILIFAFLSNAAQLSSQFEPGSQSVPDEQNRTQIVETKDGKFDKWLMPSPPTYLVRVNAFGFYSMIIIILAFILGFVNIFMGMNSGGKQNRAKIRRCVIYTVAIGFFSKPICDLVHYWLTKGVGLIRFIPYEIASSVVGTLVYVVWITYLIYSGILLYESFIVTAKEAHPM
jgi:hypothetical protein